MYARWMRIGVWGSELTQEPGPEARSRSRVTESQSRGVGLWQHDCTYSGTNSWHTRQSQAAPWQSATQTSRLKDFGQED